METIGAKGLEQLSPGESDSSSVALPQSSVAPTGTGVFPCFCHALSISPGDSTDVTRAAFDRVCDIAMP